MFKISVVIPVYNAEEFIHRAVKSASSEKETDEIILIEDGSEDSSYSRCVKLAKKYSEVKLFTHEGRKNKGAGASRNLGIQKASNNYISFLDADDFFLEDRFKETKKVFDSYPNADGVYEAIGVHFENDNINQKWEGNGLTTIEGGISPAELFWKQAPIGSKGYTSLDGLTIKKTALQDVGLFNPELRLHQDTDLFMRLAIACKLYPGSVQEPVAMRRVHQDNRISRRRTVEEIIYNKRKMWNATYNWSYNNGHFDEAKIIENKIKYCRLDVLNEYERFRFSDGIKQYFTTINSSPSIIFELSFYMKVFKFIGKCVSNFLVPKKFYSVCFSF